MLLFTKPSKCVRETRKVTCRRIRIADPFLNDLAHRTFDRFRIEIGPGVSLGRVAELLGDSKRVAADHYVYALTDYREIDRSIALARASR